MDPVSQTLPAAAPTQGPPATSAPADASGGASGALTADFETFLKLLTTQMQNQDPQNPLDSTQFVAQLASFSAVEQQIATNTKLDALVAALSPGASGQMAEWIGAAVRSTAAVEFSGKPVDIHFSTAADAVSAQVIVKTASGAEIARIAVEPGATTAQWDGTGSDGLTAPDGRYTFEIESFDRTSSLGREPAEAFSTVTEVRKGPDGLTLVFADGTTMAADSVEAIR